MDAVSHEDRQEVVHAQSAPTVVDGGSSPLAEELAQPSGQLRGAPVIPTVCPQPLSPHTRRLDDARGPAGYALRRVVAIVAAQEVLAKHLGQLAKIDRQLSVLFLRRAEVQTRCWTEHDG